MENILLVVLALGAVTCAAGEVPRPEHPQPQLVRAEWLNLNGTWEFAESDDADAARFLGSEPYPDVIVVPFCRESTLSGLERKDFVKNVWYRRTFEVPSSWKSPRVRLHVGACDWRTRVWVNGQPVGEHTGGNVAFAFDITEVLREGANTVIVHAFDDTASGLQALGKQSIRGKSFGIFYTPTTGIWQTVWIEGVGESYIEQFSVDPDPARSQALLNVGIQGRAQGLTLRAEAFIEGVSVAVAARAAQWRDNRLALELPEKRLWSVEDPFLYNLTLTLLKGDVVVDQVASYFGLRQVTIEGAAILLNGRPVFQRLVLDQGFYPDGVWTAPSDAELRADIERSQACGFNGARLHQKVFEPRFFYWADTLGYLVWGEFPSFGADYGNPAVNTPILHEWAEIVARDRNHPSVIGWCPFNETQPISGPLQAAVVRMTRDLDPSRPVIESSGYAHTIADPEVLDAHDYDQDPVTFRTRWEQFFGGGISGTLPARYGAPQAVHIPFFVSEYGGIGWNVEKGAWGYGNDPKTLEEFYARFQGLADAQLDNRFLFGLCYTQLTNIEQEQNGVYRYDRTPKFDVARLKAILSRQAAYEKDPPLEAVSRKPVDWTVLVGALQDASAAPWHYTTDKPDEAWTEAGFDDARWEAGLAPFGQKGAEWDAKIRSKWSTHDIWLRQSFECADTAFDLAAIVLHHDDDAEAYLNGKPIWSGARWNDQYQGFDVTDAVRGALLAGKNLVAVHVHQDRGGQYIDLALLLGRH